MVVAIDRDGTNDYYVKSEGVMETHWQLQFSRTPPAPISLAGGRAPNASVYATWYLFIDGQWLEDTRLDVYTRIWMRVNDLLLTM